MAGTIGPLETRPTTNVMMGTDLAFLDASPWISGELAFVISTQQTYELFREDNTSVIDNFNVIAVGPNSNGIGRWKRTCSLCSGPTGAAGPTGPAGPTGVTGPESCSNTAFTQLNVDFSNNSITFVPFLTASITTTTGNFLEVLFTMSGTLFLEDVTTGVAFTLELDGEIIPVSGQSSSFNPGNNTVANVRFGSAIILRRSIFPGNHTVIVYARITGSPGTIDIEPTANPETDHANLYLEEVCGPSPIQ